MLRPLRSSKMNDLCLAYWETITIHSQISNRFMRHLRHIVFTTRDTTNYWFTTEITIFTTWDTTNYYYYYYYIYRSFATYITSTGRAQMEQKVRSRKCLCVSVWVCGFCPCVSVWVCGTCTSSRQGQGKRSRRSQLFLCLCVSVSLCVCMSMYLIWHSVPNAG